MGVERIPALTELLGLVRTGEEGPALDAQDLLQAVLANVTDFVVVCRPDGTILFLNRYHPGVMPTTGRSAFDEVSPEDRPKVESAFRTVIELKQPAEYDTTAVG